VSTDAAARPEGRPLRSGCCQSRTDATRMGPSARDMQAGGQELREVEMAEPAKCAHPACDCVVQQNSPYGKYCSDYCKRAAQTTELHCNCHHPGCR
jgi:hypothetical protein